MCRRIKCNGTDFWECRMWWASLCSPRRNKLPRDHLLLRRRPGRQISSPRAQFIIILSLLEKYKLFVGQRCQAPCIKWVLLFQSLVPLSTIRTNSIPESELEHTWSQANIHPQLSYFTQSRQFCHPQSGISPSPWENGPVLPGGFSLMFFLPHRLFTFAQLSMLFLTPLQTQT